MSTVIPEDPGKFVARAAQATNTCDTAWPMQIYAQDIRLELIGDGIHDVQTGAAAVKPALEGLYQWFAAIDAHLTKTLVATSDDTIVNTWDGTLFNGSQTTHGAEIWRFDETGHVRHNVLYTSVNPKRPSNPLAALRMLLGHPRPALAYLKVRPQVLLRTND